MPDDPPPMITLTGWSMTNDDDLYTAVREATVSEYQALNGVLPHVHARTLTELLALTSAQSRLHHSVRAAERIADAERSGNGGDLGLVLMVKLDIPDEDLAHAGGDADES